jgi:hypothetical protein
MRHTPDPAALGTIHWGLQGSLHRNGSQGLGTGDDGTQRRSPGRSGEAARQRYQPSAHRHRPCLPAQSQPGPGPNSGLGAGERQQCRASVAFRSGLLDRPGHALVLGHFFPALSWVDSSLLLSTPLLMAVTGDPLAKLKALYFY